MGYFKDTIKGVSWVAGLRYISRAIALLRIIILARFQLLLPYQFGLYGIASIVLALLEILTETGVNVFFIQQNKSIKEYIDSAWIISIVRGVILATIIWISAPFISIFFNSNDSKNIIFMIGFAPLVRGFINPGIIIFQKDLKFHKEFWFRLPILMVDVLVTIFVAFNTHNAISFVWGLIAGAIVEVILSFIFVRPMPKLQIQKEKITTILHSGKWVTLSGIFNYIAQEGDNVVVGKLLGATALGYYQNAYKLSTLPISEITDVASKVVFPVYARIAEDRKRLFIAFAKTMLIILVSTIFLGIILLLFTNQIVLLTLGKNWLIIVPVLHILAFYGVLRAVFGAASSLFLAAKRQDFVAAMTFVRFLGLTVTIVPLTMMYGIIGAGYSALFSVLIEIFLIVYFTYVIFKKKSNEKR